MCFLYMFVIALLTVFINFNCVVLSSKMDYAKEKNFNRSLFLFEDIKNCAKNEFYDLNYFQCSACQRIGENLQTNDDKFSCGCKTSPSPTTVTVYDTFEPYITCSNLCNQKQMQYKITNTTTELIAKYCTNNETTILPKLKCKFKYINRTMTTSPTQSLADFSRRIDVCYRNWQYDGLCDDCNIEYNFHYQDYCIANGLLRSFLSYNSFWQATTSSPHFGELKFVAFFCMALNNQTACHQLANLCVLSHYANDKNSPCSKFLLNQASDAVYRYGSVDELLSQQQMKPFLYYRKGKETLAELGVPIKGLTYTMDVKQTTHNHLKFFATTYALDGTLLRWGSLKLNDLNLCPYYKNSWSFVNFLRFAYEYDAIECSLTLEELIDLAKIYDNNRFISLFLNFTRNDDNDGVFLQAISILIADLLPENRRLQKEEWQLVKRFQLIQFHIRHGTLGPKAPAHYEDSHKLLIFRSLRYADKIELHYDIHENNQISIPILKLHYRHIEFTNNTTLNTKYNFKLIITYERVGETAKGELVNEIALPLSLLFALVAALFKAYNSRKRRTSSFVTTSSSTTPLTAATSQNNDDDFCHFTFFTEFLLHLISYMALAFLICFLLHVFMNSLAFLSQDIVELTLPIVKDQRSLELIIYAALILKLIYLCIYFWRLSHFHIFFIDWERPRCGDTNHFNLKNNLETSSVCSSVRTYISDSNVSAWRSIFLANEWIQLSGKQKTSRVLQGLTMVAVARILNIDNISHNDVTLEIFYISLLYIVIYICQYVILSQILTRFTGNPIQKYIDHCSLANNSIFTLIEPSFGYYIHGRSPHGFADSDMTTMLMQLQRETHSICGRRGLLSDTDQCYVIMPPKNLSNYFDKLLLPYQRSIGGTLGAVGGGGGVGSTATHFQKEINSIEGNLEKTSVAYCSVNRFFCAFIDHGIKDMDYIIKEKTIVERLFDCEFENYLTDNKGTFYIDTSFSFTQMFLYGNEWQMFILEFLLLLAIYLIFSNLLAAVIAVCIFNKIFQSFYRYAVKENISNKTLIDKRFLI